MSPQDYFKLTQLQKDILILNWNEEQKREQKELPKWKGRGKRVRRR
jgi:hypothetical protein